MPRRLRRHGPDVSRFLEYPARFDVIGVFFSVQKAAESTYESLRPLARPPFGRGERQGINDQMRKTDGVKFPDSKN